MGRCAITLSSLVKLGNYVWGQLWRAGLLVLIKNRSLGDGHGDLQPDLFPVELYGDYCTGCDFVFTKKVEMAHMTCTMNLSVVRIWNNGELAAAHVCGLAPLPGLMPAIRDTHFCQPCDWLESPYIDLTWCCIL